ncbi:hypothetical protein LXL04_012313 [Taraxacum kok-saghyz]
MLALWLVSVGHGCEGGRNSGDDGASLIAAASSNRNMRGHRPPEEGWTTVNRRKKQQTYHFDRREITSYYVTGFPDGTRKEELRKPFGVHGNVVDIYFGGRKDAQRKNYAFIRYKGIEDAKKLEETLQGIKCRERVLAVNISKHQRPNPVRHNAHPPQKTRWHPTTMPAPQDYSGTGNQRHPTNQGNVSYAQAVSGDRTTHMRPTAPAVHLNPNTYMAEWLKKSVLIGEAHSFDHIGTLHASQILTEETKYLGGLRLAITFNSSTDAIEFLEDKARWRDWFRWVVRADQQALKYERTAWIKILGLPLHLWDEQNFTAIASRFGRIVSPFDNISHRRDYSMGKVGVLTSEQKWINEEITVKAGGIEYKVGIVEYTDDWSPFKPLPFDKVEESDEEDQNEEAVSDTWMDEEPEEGEIRPPPEPKNHAEFPAKKANP